MTPPTTPLPPPASTQIDVLRFQDRTSRVGLSYVLTSDSRKTGETLDASGGLAMDDIDNDGMLELYVAHGRNAKGRLFDYVDGRFVAIEDNNGISPSAMDRAGYFVDLDGDGWKDFVSIQYENVEVFMNDRTGHFVEATASSNIQHYRSTFSLAAGDFDLDGDLDLFFAHWAGTFHRGDVLTEYLWENDGSGRFRDVSYLVAIRDEPFENLPNVVPESSFTPTFADIDSDGYPDMLLASDYGTSQVLRNEGGYAFADATSGVISDKNGMGGAVADYDRDGDLDWFVSSIHDLPNHGVGTDTGNRLYRNVDGLGNFEDVTDASGVRNGDWGWGSCFADFDNDGHLDIFHTTGMQENGDRYMDDPAHLFVSDGDGTFTERAESSGITHTGQGRGVVCTDYNDDGKIDILIANNGESPTVYENDSENDHHYLFIDLTGTGRNPGAIGARVTVTSPSGVEQMHEVQLGTWYLSQGPHTLHFGFGEEDEVSKIEVLWPGRGGITSELHDVGADQRIEIEHP